MATAHRIINRIACNSADWHNCERSLSSINDPLDSLIQQIMHHPMKDCVSVPWLFSYHYQQMRKRHDVEESKIQACALVVIALDRLY